MNKVCHELVIFYTTVHKVYLQRLNKILLSMVQEIIGLMRI